MRSFHTRIDLLDGTPEDYQVLHQAMRECGFSRTMLGADRRVLHLSQVQYLFHSASEAPAERERINTLALQSAESTSKLASIVTIETEFGMCVGAI